MHNGGLIVSGLAIAVLAPFLMALLVPFIHRSVRTIHTGWFVLFLPVVLFCYFLGYMSHVWQFETVTQQLSWIPSLGIDFTLYLDGLSLLFVLLITGIGSLVVLYSI